LIVLVLVVEKAALFHAKTHVFIAFDRETRDPPLFRPIWRLMIYAGYLAAGLFALRAPVQRPIAIALVVLPIFLLVALDILALRRRRADAGSSRTEAIE
jgi:hypothetical protein